MITKRASVLRRVLQDAPSRFVEAAAEEGDVCAFEVTHERPITIEATSGRMMEVAPGEVFLGAPGWLQTRRMAVGGIPAGGLVPGAEYWILSYSGVVGELTSCYSPSALGHLGRVRYLGVAWADDDRALNIRRFALAHPGHADRQAPVHLILGTSNEVGKSTAGVSIVRALRLQGHSVIALKATGLASIGEIGPYEDFGASPALDCIDFGLPTTFPQGRPGIEEFLGQMLDCCFALPADSVVVECAGDPVSANAPELLCCLKARRPRMKIVLAAADALGALGAKHVLAEMGLGIDLITGPCTDTPVLRQRTEALCGIPAINLSHGSDDLASPDGSSTSAFPPRRHLSR